MRCHVHGPPPSSLHGSCFIGLLPQATFRGLPSRFLKLFRGRAAGPRMSLRLTWKPLATNARALASVVLLLGLSGGGLAGQEATPKIEPRADQMIRALSDFLVGLDC